VRPPVTLEIITTCAICGHLVRSQVSPNWKASRRAMRAHRDMQAHLKTHSFAELLRFEIRQDLEQVPEEQRPSIVRDVYRSLLGVTRNGRFELGRADAAGTYSIDEVLGGLNVYRVWQTSNRCSDPTCDQH
jgi:hypothetical protein